MFAVAEPCELGCSGLSFCSNFNFRPTEMFRRCDAEADQMAMKTMQIWSQGAISLPLILPYDIPVKGN
jgi:reversion-inducing cysteine-rich kazal motif protein